MLRTAFSLPRIAAIAAVLVAASAVPGRADLASNGEVCGEYGTSVVFADSPADAAGQALKEEKLVFVLHVSGHFEEADYT